MKNTIVSLVAAAVIGVAGISAASQIASPAVYAAPTQKVAHCVLGNIGSSQITAALKIVDEGGNVVATDDTCIVDPHFICEINAFNIGTGQAYACTATITSGSPSRLRGSMQLIGSDGVVLRSEPLH